MIVAVATENEMVAQHFGRCPEYTLYRLANQAVEEKKVIANPGHEPGYLPGYLSALGVSCIIAGGMGQRAQSLFDAERIKTYVGISGPVNDVIDAYLCGELQSGISCCEHEHGGHHCG